MVSPNEVKESEVVKDEVHLPWMLCQFSEETAASAFIEAGTARSAAAHTSIWSSIPDIVSPISDRRVIGKLTLGWTLNSDLLSNCLQERETHNLEKQKILNEAG